MGDLTPAPAARATRPLTSLERRARGREAATAAVFLLGVKPTDRALAGWGIEAGYLKSHLDNQEATP